MGSARRPQKARRAETSRGSEKLFGIHCVREALLARRRPLVKLLLESRGPQDELEALAAKIDLPTERVASLSDVVATGPRSNPQGVCLLAGPVPELSLEELLASAKASGAGGQNRRIVALDGVEDPQNLGAIIRVAEGSGAIGLVLTRRHAPPLSSVVARASSGALEWLPIARVANLTRALGTLKSHGFWVVGADTAAKQTIFELPDRLFTGDLVLALGSEGQGMRDGVLKCVDHPVRIPMVGRVGSLNVATAGSVLLFEALRRTLAREEALP
jgi:23S rRNA (guanosine2251-2'-O)-methyltransferase